MEITDKDWDGFLNKETPERKEKLKVFFQDLKTLCARHQANFLLKRDGKLVNPQDLADGRLNLIAEPFVLQDGMYRLILF